MTNHRKQYYHNVVWFRSKYLKGLRDGKSYLVRKSLDLDIFDNIIVYYQINRAERR